MANNFRITGTQYFSKNGVDANAGTSVELPKVTLSQVTTNQTAIVGAGVYKGSFTLSTGAGSPSYIADGTIVIDATANIVAQPNDNVYNTFLNTSTQNKHTIWVRLNTFTYTATRGQYHNNVNFIGGTYTHTGSASTTPIVTGCNFAGITFSATQNFNFDYSKFFNSTFTISAGSTLKNSYVDEATIFVMSAFFTVPTTQFINCDFMGKFNIAGTLYELKKDKAGVDIPARIGNGINDIIAIYPTVYSTGKNFSQDALFNNIEKSDFRAVAYNSPLLFADTSLISAIGNVRYGVTSLASDAGDIFSVSQGAVISETNTGVPDLILSVGDYILNPAAVALGVTAGTVTSAPKEIAPIKQVVGNVFFARLLNFNASLAKGNAENNNITAVTNYATVASTVGVPVTPAGSNPNRLAFEARWSTKSTMPTVTADWDNNNIGVAGAYFLFEQGQIPKVDVNGKGDGDPDFVVSGSANIYAKYVQYRITVRNGLGTL